MIEQGIIRQFLYIFYLKLISRQNQKMQANEIEKYESQLRKNKDFIKKFKLFPEKTRKVKYAALLQLPLNHSHFLQLTKPFNQLPEHTSNKQTAFIVNALVKLYPTLGNQWLPGLIYPFVKLFQQDSIVCFQTSLTFLLNWYQPIYQNYPNPSKKVIDFAIKFLPKLDNKISASNYTLSAILNPMFLVCLTDVLNRQDSLKLLDFLVTNPYSPQYFLCSSVLIVSSVQQQLCRLNSVQQIAIALRKQKKLSIQTLIQKTVQMAKSHRGQLQEIYSKRLFPLTRSRYPVFQFVKTDFRKSNDCIQKAEYDKMNHLSTKYNELSGLINSKLKQGMVANCNDISDRYQDIQGQTMQYINKVKRQHQMKLQALRQIQSKFDDQINHSQEFSKSSINQRNLKVIQRRGRLQKQISNLQKQARKVREIQEGVVQRINNMAQNKKGEIMQLNRKLQAQQKHQNLYEQYQD